MSNFTHTCVASLLLAALLAPGLRPSSTQQQSLVPPDQPDWHPAWSPDGARIAFASWRYGASEIMVMEADGSNPIRLTDAAGDDDRPTDVRKTAAVGSTRFDGRCIRPKHFDFGFRK